MAIDSHRRMQWHLSHLRQIQSHLGQTLQNLCLYWNHLLCHQCQEVPCLMVYAAHHLTYWLLHQLEPHEVVGELDVLAGVMKTTSIIDLRRIQEGGNEGF
ncbi:uncharacterized protein ACHE_60736S [Aspergillus chevalieri]|uniref:Uncharacterized protein n=1 Tax=Aspergillus chevalieri TaxID=182096 RepID=A0A7R7VUA8_ASPCH|nr:uncharacterized protein ACHE_31015S [Aspergillus chevalieri]XP_043139372.1 uncharacterized protein ACHE_60736S [Aspergillus chevalieri]BCR87028.1 hypothetical protein ACHE_31015S [Aspergillus chevalieri]BCR90850.1 hypothetical protein ACHE_60736S [Aspergillus chevalieri]